MYTRNKIASSRVCEYQILYRYQRFFQNLGCKMCPSWDMKPDIGVPVAVGHGNATDIRDFMVLWNQPRVDVVAGIRGPLGRDTSRDDSKLCAGHIRRWYRIHRFVYVGIVRYA